MKIFKSKTNNIFKSSISYLGINNSFFKKQNLNCFYMSGLNSKRFCSLLNYNQSDLNRVYLNDFEKSLDLYKTNDSRNLLFELPIKTFKNENLEINSEEEVSIVLKGRNSRVPKRVI